MSEYMKFDYENRRNRVGCRLTKFLTVSKNRRSDDQRFEIMKMVPSYSNISPYNRIQDFNNKTKAVCLNTDLTMFLDECKVAIVGDANCGKSTLIKRFTTSKFEENYRPTIGVVLEQKYFNVLENGYNVGFWDMPGEEKFRQIFQSYYKNSNVIVVVFDLTRPSTLVNAARWMRDTLAANMSTDPIRFLVGTKSDLLSKRALDSLEAHASLVAQEMDAEFCAVSAKDGSEVNNLFKRITALAFENSVQKLIRPPDYHAHKNNISNLGVFRKEEKTSKNFWMWLSSCL